MTWTMLAGLAAWLVAAGSASAQEVKVPATQNRSALEGAARIDRAVRSGPQAPTPLAPLLYRERDLSRFLRLVQNTTPAGPATPGSTTVQGEVIVLLGTATPGAGIDARVRRLAAVRHPPLSLYSGIRVLSWQRYTFRPTPTTVTLPNGRRLAISIQQVDPSGRYLVQTVVSPRSGQTGSPTTATVWTAPGEPFFAAGYPHEGGTLIIGISVGTPRQ